MTDDTMSAYLQQLGSAEYRQQLDVHVRTHGRVSKQFRYRPSFYHRVLITLFGIDDPVAFSAIRSAFHSKSALAVDGRDGRDA